MDSAPLAPNDPGKKPPTRARRAWTATILAGVCLAALVFIGGMFLRTMRAQECTADREEALRNVRSIIVMLFEFDNEYGSYPNAETAAEVKEATNTNLNFGNESSNQLLRQLIAGGGGKSEKPFWAKTAYSPKKGDDNFTKPDDVLGPGDCGFAYISGLSASSDPATPVLMAPLLPGKTVFDPKPFGGFAVILFNSNGSRPCPIDKDGRVIINGMDIFDPKQPFWKGKAPDIKWPE